MSSWRAACRPASVHLIVGAHTHHVLNEGGLSAGNIVNGIPIVQAGKFGQFVGEVDITVREMAVVTHARLMPAIDLPVDEAFEQEHVQPLLARVRPYRDRIIGRVAEDPDLSTDAVRNEFASGESAFANFIADALASQAQAHGYPVDFAMIDASSVGCGLPVGQQMTFGDWFEVMPFADTLCLIRLSGRELLSLLQDNAQRLDRPGQSHTERGFLHFSQGGALRDSSLTPRASSAQAEDIRVNGQTHRGQLWSAPLWWLRAVSCAALRRDGRRMPARSSDDRYSISSSCPKNTQRCTCATCWSNTSPLTAGCCRRAVRSATAGCVFIVL